ncbi:unnamed protein product [Prorocentrum cordatum]|uniref:Uncharacterized protein n=1 Tax=Prorocentrum cordatum TaxID=2364126 RepID=A0ABN9UT27_9DINO|nr:unnamed protein product [Polarella glacialis]
MMHSPRKVDGRRGTYMAQRDQHEVCDTVKLEANNSSPAASFKHVAKSNELIAGLSASGGKLEQPAWYPTCGCSTWLWRRRVAAGGARRGCAASGRQERVRRTGAVPGVSAPGIALLLPRPAKEKERGGFS